MRTWTTIAGVLTLATGLAPACNSGAGGVGAPCETKDDCEGELICDEHEGQASCQVPHGHGDTEAETEHGSESGGMHESSSSGSESGGVHDSGSGSESGTMSESSTGSQPATDTGEATTTGGASAECEAYCGCMATNCSEYEAYPHADEAACLVACDELSGDALTCFSAFCEDAATEPNPGLAEHWCEHAWGELGTKKC